MEILHTWPFLTGTNNGTNNEIMKTELTTLYTCDYCGRLSKSKGAMMKHEVACHKNPKNWTKCIDCQYLILGVQNKQIICNFDNTSMAPIRAIRMNHGKEIIKNSDRMMPTLEEGCPNFAKNK